MGETTVGAKNIIILGTGPSMRYCDFNYVGEEIMPGSEIYGVNGTYTIPNIMPDELKPKFWMSKLFMGDTLFSFETGTLNFDIDQYNEFSEKYKCDLYALNNIRLGKHKLNSKPYPYKRIVQYFGEELFTDTVCYMIAFALYKHSYLARNPNGVIRPELTHPLTLRLFGIDMCTTFEYKQSKGGVEHWLGIARGMGCEITNAPGSMIMTNPYNVPYGQWHRLKWKKKDYDPLGLIRDGGEITTAKADTIQEKMKKDEHEKGTGTTDQSWIAGYK